MGVIDAVVAVPGQIELHSMGNTEVRQVPEGNSGIIPGNTLGDVMASPEGQKVLTLINESIQMNIASENKRHNQRAIKALKDARREMQS